MSNGRQQHPARSHRLVMDHTKSVVVLVWCSMFLLISAEAQEAADNGLLTRTINDENWYLFPSSLLQTGNINEPNSEIEPIHDIYTVKRPGGEIRRVHYAVDEHGLRANIHSNSPGLGSNTETNSIQNEPRRWPSDDFDLALEKFISMRHTKQSSGFPNLGQMIFPKPTLLSQDINEIIPDQEIKFSSSNANLPASISTKRLFTKLAPTDQQQFFKTEKALGKEIYSITNEENENPKKERAPSVVSSPNYVPSSKIYGANGFFESQRIPKPVSQFYYEPAISFDNYPNNGTKELTKLFTDEPITETEDNEDISPSEELKPSLNLEVLANLQTTANEIENEEYIDSQMVQNEFPVSEAVVTLNQTEYTDEVTQSNVSNPNLFQPILNNSISMIVMKNQIRPNFKNTFPSVSFGPAPLSTIFDSNSEEGGPYYHYVMNVGKNSGDSVSELIEKYFKSSNTNELLNKVRERILADSNKNVTRSGRDSQIFNNIANDELKLNKNILAANEINKSTLFSKGDLHESLYIKDSEEYSGKMTQMSSVEHIPTEDEISNISKAVNEQIMLIANDQEVLPSSITTDKVTDIQDGPVTVPNESIEIEKIMKEPSTNISSLKQPLHKLQEQTEKHTHSDSGIAIPSENLNNPNKYIANVETPTLQIHNRNTIAHDRVLISLPQNALISEEVFPEIIKTTPKIMQFDQDSGAMLNSQNMERNTILTTIRENSSFDELISNNVAAQSFSSDIINKSDENNSIESKKYFPNKSIIGITAKLNLLNGSQTLNSDQKEGHNLDLQMRHPLLELMIPREKLNSFMMKINNTPVILRILHPEILTSETMPHIFKIRDSGGIFSSEDFDSNYSSNFSSSLSNILDILQPNLLKYSKDSTSASPSTTVKIGPLNNAVDQIIVPIANSYKIITDSPTETLNSDLFDEENNLNNASLFTPESENIAKIETDSSFAYPDVQESRFIEFPTGDKHDRKQMIDIQLLNFKPQDTDKNEPENAEINNFHSYVANVIHGNAFPQKNIYKSRTKVQPLDINEFYKLIDKSQANDVPNGYKIVQNIANTLNGEDFRFPRFKLNDSLGAENLNDDNNVPNQDIRFNNSFDLPSSIQYVVMPYDVSNAAVRSKYEHN